MEILHKNNIQYIVGFGILLGCIREGKQIDWDHDSDLWVDEENVKKVIEILKNNDMSYYRNLGITFEEVDEFQTKMKFSKRRPFLYNMSSSLAIKYDKKLEQRINQELLTKIKKNIYVEA